MKRKIFITINSTCYLRINVCIYICVCILIMGVGDGQGGLACCDSWGRK